MNVTTAPTSANIPPLRPMPPPAPNFEKDRAAPDVQRPFGKLTDKQVAMILGKIASMADTNAQIAMFACEEAGLDRVSSYCASLSDALTLIGALADMAVDGQVRSSKPIEWILPCLNVPEGR